jgi:hypothetical protein
MASHYAHHLQAALRERAKDLASLGFAGDGRALLERAARREKSEAAPQERAPRVPLPWGAEWLGQNRDAFLRALRQKKDLFPALEYAGLAGQASRAGTLAELRATRSAAIRRLLTIRRLRPRPLRALLNGKSAEPCGPYNSQQTLSNALRLAAEHDPLWLHDFLELYEEVLS